MCVPASVAELEGGPQLPGASSLRSKESIACVCFHEMGIESDEEEKKA